MATSSITENIRIHNANALEAYADALEKAKNEPVPEKKAPSFTMMTDPEQIRELILRGIEKWGKKD